MGGVVGGATRSRWRSRSLRDDNEGIQGGRGGGGVALLSLEERDAGILRLRLRMTTRTARRTDVWGEVVRFRLEKQIPAG